MPRNDVGPRVWRPARPGCLLGSPLSRYFLRRLGSSLLLLFLVLSFTFVFVRLAPGGPEALYLDPRISAEQRELIEKRLGLDKPLVEQYGTWLLAALRGDFGTSFTAQRPAFDVILEKLPATALLALTATAIEHGIGLFLGVVAARRAGQPVDHGIRTLSLVLFSVPAFWLALLAVQLLAVQWALFPPSQMTSSGAASMSWWGRQIDLLHHLALPALVLGLARCGAVVRFCRNGLLETLGQDFVRTARAKGLTENQVLWRHALPNALVPLIQRFGLALPIMLSGSLVIEVIFSWPGVGNASFVAILQRDYPVILASTAVNATLVILGSLLADLLHAGLDPRVRLADASGEGAP